MRGWRSRSATAHGLPEHHLLEANRNLRDLLEDTQVPAAVRAELEEEFREIEALAEKLRRDEIHVAVFGRVGTGKSSLLNALIGEKLFATSPLHGETRDTQHAHWRAVAHGRVELIDTPGIDELDGETREALATAAARRADILIMVCEGDLTRIEFEALTTLARRGRPLLLVLNKADRYGADDQALLLQRLRKRCEGLLPAGHILAASADPRPATVIQLDESGREAESLRPRPPDVGTLRQLLWSVLEKEGKTIAALNAALFASELDSTIARRIVEARRAVAERIIRNYCLAKGLAVAANPVPVADLLAAAGIDVALVLHLGQVYGFQLSRREASRLLLTIATQLAALMGAYWGINLVSSALKTVSVGLSTTLTVSAQGVLAWYATYVTGSVAEAWFARGKAWDQGGPRETVRRILDTLDRDSILVVARREISGYLDSAGRRPRRGGHSTD
jgi:small GTP-binding protein